MAAGTVTSLTSRLPEAQDVPTDRAVVVRGLRRSFSEREVLRGIDIDIDRRSPSHCSDEVGPARAQFCGRWPVWTEVWSVRSSGLSCDRTSGAPRRPDASRDRSQGPLCQPGLYLTHRRTRTARK
jgi:hypothetical protein